MSGGEYPVPEVKRLAATVVNIVQMGFIGFIIAGENLFLTLGRQVPAFYDQVA